MVLIKVKAKTSYETYIDVLSAVKETIQILREEKALELFKFHYNNLVADKNDRRMILYRNLINELVPERIVDNPVWN